MCNKIFVTAEVFLKTGEKKRKNGNYACSGILLDRVRCHLTKAFSELLASGLSRSVSWSVRCYLTQFRGIRHPAK